MYNGSFNFSPRFKSGLGSFGHEAMQCYGTTFMIIFRNVKSAGGEKVGKPYFVLRYEPMRIMSFIEVIERGAYRRGFKLLSWNVFLHEGLPEEFGTSILV
jgi:hypothetical protein